MSGSGYYNYYNQQPGGSYYPEGSPQTWGSAWPMHQQQHQHYAAAAAGYSRSPNSLHSPSSTASSGQSPGYSQLRTHQQYHSSPPPPPSSSARGYQQRSSRYSSNYDNEHLSQNGYGNRQQQNWPRHQKYKRTRTESGETLEPKSKGSKKKKKPLSQNNPTKKEWTPQEAEMALKVERELNKRFNQSLLIKFPDLELSKEIVAKFHPAIEDVKFHQPHASRSCFVTLSESANTDAVIRELNKQKFGEGHITAEYKKDNKKDGEDYQNVGPEDIDPTTLYVGNLANNVTVEDIIRIFPKGRRKDVGFARKMKNTRYAFVCFHTVADAIEALKKTHNTDLHCKSLIVRFRRLNNSFGLSDEVRQQNAAKTPVNDTTSEINGSAAKDDSVEHQEIVEEVNNSLPELASPCNDSIDSSSVSPQFSQRNELEDSDAESYGIQGDLFTSHKPKVKTEFKINVKREPEENSVPRLKQEPIEEAEAVTNNIDEAGKEKSAVSAIGSSSIVKSEPQQIFNVDVKDVVVKEEPRENSDSEDSGCLDDEGGLGVKSFDSLYDKMKYYTSEVYKKE